MTNSTRAFSSSSPSTTGSESRLTDEMKSAAQVPTTTQSASLLAWREVFRPSDVPIPEGFEEIDAAVELLERERERRAALAAARQRLGPKLGARVGGLAGLRLRRGLSQKQLAQAIGTSQPHIARIENGRDNVLLATANQLAQALHVSLTEINAALGFERRSA